MFWGQCEALDLFNEYLNVLNDPYGNPHTLVYDNGPGSSTDVTQCDPQKTKPAKEINILIFGSNDPRHLIKTMAKMYTHKENGTVPIINMYVVDGCIEVMARNLALLGIALENSKLINLRTKVQLFMDIYGNSLVRASSHQYLVAKAKVMLKMITDNECLERLAPMLSIECLKYRERDGLENALHFWCQKEDIDFDIKKYWCDRVRKLLGTRYDYRDGQFDWDLNMVLKERGGSQICPQEYRYWRETGVAFTFPEFEYCKPNKTLSAGLVRNGGKYVHSGYVGDIQTGPFVTFGLTTSDQRMLKSVHGENDYRSTDITERNLLELFHELTTRTPYKHDLTSSRKYGSVRLQMSKCLACNDGELQNVRDYDDPWIDVIGAKIHFLSLDDVFTLQDSNNRWTHFFDVVFVAHNYFPFLKDPFADVLRPQSVLILETKRLTTERKHVVESFEEKLVNFAERTNLRIDSNYKSINSKRSFLKFKK